MPRSIDDNNNNNNNDDNEVVSKEEGEKSRGKTKKGPWTLSEDIMLREYVMKYGEGNWNSVQKNSGLARCGKSCRLRWANHLRPNLKKGAFSKEEEEIIVQLHATLGNKWARMAAQLPGRTDNEIKNFWNTRVKRCQRAGLPLYPPEVLHEANVYHRQQQYIPQPYTSLSFSFSPFLSSSYHQEINELSHPSFANTQQNPPNSFYFSNPPCPQFKCPNEKNTNGNVGLPLSPISPYRSSTSSLFNRCFTVNNSNDYRSRSHNYGFNSNATMPSSPYKSLPLMQGSNTEASLSLSPPSSTTFTSSYASGTYGFMRRDSSMANNGYFEVAPLSPQGNSGLLDAVAVEARSLCYNDKSKSEDSTTSEVLSHKRKSIVTEECTKKEDNVIVESGTKSDGNTANKTQRGDLCSSQISKGNKQITEDELEKINSMDDDLFGLLKNFQEMPVPDWYQRKGQPLRLETQQDTSLGPIDQEFLAHESFWRNMPNMY